MDEENKKILQVIGIGGLCLFAALAANMGLPPVLYIGPLLYIVWRSRQKDKQAQKEAGTKLTAIDESKIIDAEVVEGSQR